MSQATAPPSAINTPATTTVVDKLRAAGDDQLIRAYVKARDKRDADKKAFNETQKPLLEGMRLIETVLLERLLQRGSLNTRTEAGTAYVSDDVSVTVNGWSQTLDFIKENELWELLEARVSKTAAQEIIAERQADIPGVVVRREKVVNIRRTS